MKKFAKQVASIQTESFNNLQQFTLTKTRLEKANEELMKVADEIDKTLEAERKAYEAKVESLKNVKEHALVQLADNEGAIQGIIRLLNGGA